MGSFQVLFLVSIFIVSSLALDLIGGAHKDISNNLTATECGQTLHVTSSAKIEYQAGTDPGNFLICPVIIRFQGAGSLNFELETNDLDDFSKVSIATIELHKYPPVTLLHSRDIGGIYGSDAVTLPGSVAVIILVSSYTYDGKFVIRVTKASESDLIFSEKSVDLITAVGSGNLIHPATGGNYDNNELSLFLLAPPDYDTHCHRYGCTQIEYTEVGLEGPCFDAVDVFTFERDLPGSWIRSRLLCSGERYALLSNLLEMGLIIFRSDRTQTAGGFSVNFNVS